MSGNVKLLTPSSGSVTITTGDTASNLTVTVPAATDTLVNLSSSQTLSNKTLSNPAFTGSPSGGTFTSTTITAANSNTVEATSGPTSTQLAGQRNKIINGAMMIDQRSAGAAVTPTGDNTYTLDRWVARLTQASKFSVQQVTDAPSGFYYSIKCTSLSAYSVGASDFFGVAQYFEGLNTVDLNWGTANASTVTISFWVKSSLTGTFGGTVFGYANGYPSYPFSYSISQANTWEYKTITITGPTSGSFVVTSAGNIVVSWGLGVGSSLSGTANTWNYSTLYRAPTGATSVVGTNGATFYITGVQLEKGATATPFENRLYGTELALCQRYCFVETNDSSAYRWFAQGYNVSTTGASTGRPLPVPMRSSPSVTWTDITKFIVDQPTTGGQACTSMTASFISPTYARFFPAVASGLTTNWPVALASNGDSLLRSITYSAEL